MSFFVGSSVVKMEVRADVKYQGRYITSDLPQIQPHN